MSDSLTTIPFDAITVGGTARMGVIGDVQYLSIRDILMHICELSTVAANQKWRLLPDEVKAEVAQFLGNLKFPGKGNKIEPVITFKGALKLVMLVSGQKAALYRTAMVSILSRYYAGDGSLTDEIEANAKSAAPIQQMARASLAIETVQVEERSLEYKRKREELEMCKIDVEIESIKRGNQTAEYEHFVKVSTSYRELCQDTVMDEKARLIFKDSLLTKAMLQGPTGEPVTNPSPTRHPSPSPAPVTNPSPNPSPVIRVSVSPSKQTKRKLVKQDEKAPLLEEGPAPSGPDKKQPVKASNDTNDDGCIFDVDPYVDMEGILILMRSDTPSMRGFWREVAEEAGHVFNKRPRDQPDS